MFVVKKGIGFFLFFFCFYVFVLYIDIGKCKYLWKKIIKNVGIFIILGLLIWILKFCIWFYYIFIVVKKKENELILCWWNVYFKEN